jgi:hypothetical protein
LELVLVVELLVLELVLVVELLVLELVLVVELLVLELVLVVGLLVLELVLVVELLVLELVLVVELLVLELVLLMLVQLGNLRCWCTLSMNPRCSAHQDQCIRYKWTLCPTGSSSTTHRQQVELVLSMVVSMELELVLLELVPWNNNTEFQ